MPSTAGDDDERMFNLLRQVKTHPEDTPETRDLKGTQSGLGLRRASILVVDDLDEYRETLVQLLQEMGYGRIAEAEDGQAALELLQRQEFDLILLDIEMPRLDGFGVLARLKQDPRLRDIPVVVASAIGKLDAVVQCIEMGAEDFLPKPVHAVLLRARVTASLERKRLRDLERLRLKELQIQQETLEIEAEKSERLLLNILPQSIAERLKRGAHVIAERFPDVTVLFADLVGFTEFANQMDPEKLVTLLNDIFSRFDDLTESLGLEKIKTIGDGYLVVGGLPEPRKDHAEAVADLALAMPEALAEVNRKRGTEFGMRIGLNTGPVVAGVIGRKKFSYDLWGSAVNLASRMESTGVLNRVHLPQATYELLKHKFDLTENGETECKGIGRVHAYLLEGRK